MGALAGGLLLGGLLEAAGHGLRRRLRIPGIGVVDGLGGALLAAAVALGLVWIAGAVALQTPGASRLRADIQRSALLRALNRVLPPSGPVLNALARFDPVRAVRGVAGGGGGGGPRGRGCGGAARGGRGGGGGARRGGPAGGRGRGGWGGIVAPGGQPPAPPLAPGPPHPTSGGAPFARPAPP